MRADGTVAEWSARAEDTFGWTRSEALNRPMAEMIIPAPQRADHYRGLKHYMKTGHGPLLRRRIETIAVRRNGEEFPVELAISPLNRGGELLFVGFLRDISERQRAQAMLARQARHAALLYQVTSLAAETTSLEDILQLCLDAICQLTEWPVGHAYLPAKDGSNELVPSNIWHSKPNDYQLLRRVTEKTRFAPGVGLPGVIWQSKEPHWIPDVSQTGANFPRFKEQPNLEVRAGFGIPIKSGSSVIAVLEFFNDEVTELDPQILLTARAFGDQVGRVLERREVMEHQQLLIAELNHRVKNMLMVVLGVATQTMRNSPSMAAFQEGFTARLIAMSRSYDLLASTRWQPTALDRVINDTVSPHVGDMAQIHLSGPPVWLAPEATLAMSMIVHELVTNAIKYGGLSVPEGKITVTWALTAGDPARREIALRWKEHGLKALAPPQDKPGFGSRLIETMVSHELGGTIAAAYEPEGVRYDLRFPVNR